MVTSLSNLILERDIMWRENCNLLHKNPLVMYRVNFGRVNSR